MAGTHRSVSSFSWRPTSRILGALFAGSAVMFTAVALQDGSPVTAGSGPGAVSGPRYEEEVTAPVPSPGSATVPQLGSPGTAADGVAPPVTTPGSAEIATRPSPARIDIPAQEIPPVPGAPADRTPGWGPDATRQDRDISSGEVMVQPAPARTGPVPVLPSHDQSNTGGATAPAGGGGDNDNGVVKGLLGLLGSTTLRAAEL